MPITKRQLRDRAFLIVVLFAAFGGTLTLDLNSLAQTAQTSRRPAGISPAVALEKAREAVNRGDRPGAMRWYRTAAEQGSTEAAVILAGLYENEKNQTQAVVWWREAAKQGDVLAEYKMGFFYLNGRGVKQDYTEAMSWFRKAADQGDAEAQYSIGVLYGTGHGTEYGTAPDYDEALRWYRKAAEQGLSRAEYNVGYYYQKGFSVKQDYAEAMTWFRKAADKGYGKAEFAIGTMYDFGNGVPRDDVEALRWYRKGADHGSAEAAYNIGMFYAEGRGELSRNSDEARVWVERAAAGGVPQAKEWLRATSQEVVLNVSVGTLSSITGNALSINPPYAKGDFITDEKTILCVKGKRVNSLQEFSPLVGKQIQIFTKSKEENALGQKYAVGIEDHIGVAYSASARTGKITDVKDKCLGW